MGISIINKKSKHHHWNLHIWISVSTKFQLKLTILILWNKFAQKEHFQSKKERMNIPMNSAYSDWSKCLISLGTKFRFKQTILYFGTKFAQNSCFLSKTKKSEHNHWILHIWISLGTKIQLKLTIFNFWTKFAQKGYFKPKAE